MDNYQKWTNSPSTHEKMVIVTHNKRMQLKITVRHYLSPAKLAKLEKFANILCWNECRKTGPFILSLGI